MGTGRHVSTQQDKARHQTRRQLTWQLPHLHSLQTNFLPIWEAGHTTFITVTYTHHNTRRSGSQRIEPLSGSKTIIIIKISITVHQQVTITRASVTTTTSLPHLSGQDYGYDNSFQLSFLGDITIMVNTIDCHQPHCQWVIWMIIKALEQRLKCLGQTVGKRIQGCLVTHRRPRHHQ